MACQNAILYRFDLIVLMNDFAFGMTEIWASNDCLVCKKCMIMQNLSFASFWGIFFLFLPFSWKAGWIWD